MSTPVPNRPVLLLDLVKTMVHGDDQNQASRPLPKDTRDALVADRDALETANTQVLAAKTAWQEAVQARKSIVKRTRKTAQNVRNVVYGLHGRTDKTLGEYGLSTPVEHRSKDVANGTNGTQPK